MQYIQGEAMEVPLNIWEASSLEYQAEVMCVPGAYKSTQLPKFEYVATESFALMAPTVMALGVDAGEYWQASTPSFPARQEQSFY